MLGLQPVSVILGPDGVPSSYGAAPVGSTMPSTDHGSSTSSIASSYDTAPAAGGMDNPHYAMDAWNRARRNGSGNSLAAFIDTSGRGATTNSSTTTRRMTQSTSDNNIASRHRHRTASLGSGSEASSSYNTSEQQGRLSRSGSVGSWQQQRPERMYARSESSPESSRPRTSPRGRRGDEGFTMMTSALLTMLDHTPEEASMESYSDDDPYHRTTTSSRHEVPNSMVDQQQSMLERLSLGKEEEEEDDHEAWSRHHAPWQSSFSMNGQHHHSATTAAGPPPTGHNNNNNNNNGHHHHSDIGLYFP